MKKKSQIWYTDFIVGLSIFTIMLIVTFRYTTLKLSVNDQDKERAWDDAQRISESLLSLGIPQNWTEQDALSLGILSENSVIDLVKVEKLKNFTNANYDRTRNIIGMKSDYILHFESINGSILNITNQQYIGKPGYTDQIVQDLSPKESLFFVRYLVYRHDGIAEIVGMRVLVWQK